MLRFALLGLLLRQAMTGYELERTIRESIDNIWSAQLSQIYRTLRQLEDGGLVVSQVEPQEGRPDRRVYTITPDGEQEFRGWLGELVTDRDPLRVPFLVRFFFSGQRPAADTLTQLRIMRDIWVRERDRFSGPMAVTIATAGQALGPGDPDPLYWDATRRAGEMMAQTWIDWIDETMARISSASGSEGPQAAQNA